MSSYMQQYLPKSMFKSILILKVLSSTFYLVSSEYFLKVSCTTLELSSNVRSDYPCIN